MGGPPPRGVKRKAPPVPLRGTPTSRIRSLGGSDKEERGRVEGELAASAFFGPFFVALTKKG